MRKKIIFAVVLLLANSVQAGEWRIGHVIGYTDYEIENQACDTGLCQVDDADISVGIVGSYNFTKNWGLEAGYLDLGNARIRGAFRSAGGDFHFDHKFGARLGYLAATATHYFSDKFSVTGRLGFAKIDVQSSIGFIRDSIDQEPVYGLSLDYRWASRFSTGIRYDYVGELDTESVSFTSSYIF